DQAADVHRDVALALTEDGREVLERQRRRPQVEDGEDAALGRGDDAGRGRGRAQAADEDAGRPVHLDHAVRLEYSERTVKRGRPERPTRAPASGALRGALLSLRRGVGE